MFRALALVALVAFVSAEDAQGDFAEFQETVKSALASLDPAFVEKIKQIGENVDLSRNQKNIQIAEAMHTLPADQQEKAEKFHQYLLQKEKEMIAHGKTMISEFSNDAQAILNKIVVAYENGADVPTKTLFEQLNTIFEGASEAVKAEFNKKSVSAKVEMFADALIPTIQAEKLIH